MKSKKISNDQELIQSDPISCPPKVITLKIKQTANGIRENIAKREPFLSLCKRFHFNHSYLSWIRDDSSKRNSPKHLNLFHLKHYVEYDSSPYLRLKLSKLVEISKNSSKKNMKKTETILLISTVLYMTDHCISSRFCPCISDLLNNQRHERHLWNSLSVGIKLNFTHYNTSAD